MATNTHMTNDGDDHGKMMTMMMDEEEACCYGMILATGAALPMVVNAMIDLDVFEIIKRAGPGTHLSPIQIAARLPGPTRNLDAPIMLDRILRLLATHSIVSCLSRTRPDGRVERVYGLGPVCKFLNKNEEGINCGVLSLLSHNKVVMESWYHLKEAIMEGGISFNKAHGKGTFEYAGSDPIFNKIFNDAMTNITTFTMEKVLNNYKGFEGISTLVDIGGNIGTSLSMIVAKYPNIKGINFDLPHVVNTAPTYPGLEHIGGNMFESVPTGDAIFMKNVCHDWSDEHCMKLLKNCYDALPDHGKVINCDFILPSTPENSQEAKMLFQLDVLLMTHANGKERTTQEFETLAKAAGFKVFRVVFSAYHYRIMEFLKNN